MSLGINKRSMSNGSKILSLSYCDGKYSVTYQHGTQKYDIKNNIDDEGYANYIFDQLYDDIFKNDFFNNNKQTINDIKKSIKTLESDFKIMINMLSDTDSIHTLVNNISMKENINKLKRLVEKLK